MPRVPFELSDYIIDFLHDDPKALRSCALTCYSWLFASRFHLFRSISLQNRSVADPLERLLRASPELGLYVRDLTVTKFTTNKSESAPTAPPPTPAVPHPAQDAEPTPTKALDTALPRILAALPALRTLSLSHTDMKCIGGMHAVRLPTVSALSVSFCQFADFADVVDLVGCFPALRELSLAGLTWKEEVRTPTAVLAPTLRTLALGRDLDSERLFAWFEAAAFHTSVTALAVRCASERDAALVGPFLERVGGSLRSLELDWSFTGDKSECRKFSAPRSYRSVSAPASVPPSPSGTPASGSPDAPEAAEGVWCRAHASRTMLCTRCEASSPNHSVIAQQ